MVMADGNLVPTAGVKVRWTSGLGDEGFIVSPRPFSRVYPYSDCEELGLWPAGWDCFSGGNSAPVPVLQTASGEFAVL